MALGLDRTNYTRTRSGWLFNPGPYLGCSLQERCSQCSMTYGQARHFALACGKSEEYCFFKCHLAGCGALMCMECLEGPMRMAMTPGFIVICLHCHGTLCTTSVYKQFQRYDPRSFLVLPGYGLELCDATPAMVKRATERVTKYAQLNKLKNGPDDFFFGRRNYFIEWYRDWYRQPRDRPWLYDDDVTAEDAWDMFWATAFGQPYSLSPAPASDSDIMNKIRQLSLPLTHNHVCIYFREELWQHDPATCTCGWCTVAEPHELDLLANIDPFRLRPASTAEQEEEEEEEQEEEREPPRRREVVPFGREVQTVTRLRVMSL